MSRSRRFVVSGSIAVAVGLSVASAVAGPPKANAATVSETDEVRELMRAGVAEYKKGNLQAARDAFLKAWGIRPHYAIAASLAEVEMALGLYRSTAEHLEYYLSNLPDELGDKRGPAETQLSEAMKHLAAVRVVVDSPDATIYMDGIAVEAQGRELLVDPGSHVFMAELGNVRTKPADVVLTAGESREVRLELQPHAAPAPAPPPPVLPKTAAAPADSSSQAPMYVLLAGGALTLAAVAVGVGYTVDSASAQSDADRYADETARTGKPTLVAQNAQCSPTTGAPAACASLRDSLDQSNRSHDIALGAFVAAGVIGVGTVVTYLLWPTEKPRADRVGVRVAPWVGPSARGASVAIGF